MTGAILLVGCGKMGTALLEGWLARGIDAADVQVIEPDAAGRQAIAALGVGVGDSAEALPGNFDPATVIFAIKPQVMETAVPAYTRFAGRAHFISIAAGKPISFFERLLGSTAAVIRVMPNTPAAVGRGMSVAVANANTDSAARQRASELLQAVGAVAWIEDESLMDAVTAVSGSGPAYVFLLVECMAAAGVAAGLDEPLARQLARETVVGSGELLRQADEDAATLRRNVTSPGGTTEAALAVLMAEDGLAPLLVRAIRAAADRSRELA